MKKYKITSIFTLIGIFLLLSIYTTKAYGQWTEQTILLKPGWNAVYLEVQPEPRDCDEIFENVPVESVWTCNPTISLINYIPNPDTLLPQQPHWLVYFPPGSPDSILTNLFTLLGRRAYLIKLKGNKTVERTLVGRPCIPKIKWEPNSFNFVGFHLAPGQEPFFESFFAPSPAHAGQKMYRLNENDVWEEITIPSATVMRYGEAYWIYCKGHSNYTGPLVCRPEQGKGLDFGKVLTEQTFHVRNLSSSPTEISISSLKSIQPADTEQPAVAGDVPLLYWKFEPEKNEIWWHPLPDSLPLTAASGEEKLIRLAVKLRDMSPTGISQSILQVTNGQGMRVFVPVNASGRSSGDTNPVREKDGGTGFIFDGSLHAGLWVGNAVINHVSQIWQDQNQPQPEPQPTATEFQFRLIIHYGEKEEIDNDGNQVFIDNIPKARLLREIIQMWKDGTYETIENPIYPYDKNQVVKDPGCYVLLTDESLFPHYSGASLQRGKPVGRRISSVAFGFQKITEESIDNQDGDFTIKEEKVMDEPITMNINNQDGSTVLSCSVEIKPDDPLNPYKHKYHPDHDNLGPDGKPLQDNRIWDAYEIIRDIEMAFTLKDPLLPEDASDDAHKPGWGVTDIGGIYFEKITGIHKNPIFIKGYFHLHKVSHGTMLTSPSQT